MSATAAVVARDRYLRDFRAFASNGGRSAPGWLSELRERAASRFADIGFPGTRQEAWRFTNVTPVLETAFTPPPAGTTTGISISGLTIMGDAGHRLVFVNGRHEPGLSAPGRLPGGVRFQSMVQALGEQPDLVAQHLGRHARYEENGFTALSTAFLQDGAVVHVPRGVEVPEPLEILFLSTHGAAPAVSYPRVLVIVEERARATVVERYAGPETGVYLTNAVAEFAIGADGRLDHCRVQQEGPRAYHVAETQSHLSRGSVLESCSVAVGSALARHGMGAVLDGPGANLVMNGLLLAGGHQHLDHHTTIDHAQPHCESHELFNGIFDDQSRGVFTGRIIVRPGAQRTDSKQTSNNLLLSPEARADSQPQLEIYADDVKCTHGATLGPVDDAAMFYLRSRGLDVHEARNLLTYGFAADIISRIGSEPVRSHLYPLLLERLCRQRTGTAAA